MSNDVARAVGAGAVIAVNGKEYRLAPLGLRQLQEIQKAALRSFKTQYLQTYIDNEAILPRGTIEDKLDEVARWDINDLPSRIVYDVAGVPINDELRERLRAIYPDMVEESSESSLLATALDTKEITATEVYELTDVKPRKGLVSYDLWWITARFDGQCVFVWASLQKNHPEVTAEEVANWPMAKLVEASRTVESITSPAVGNT